MKKILINLVIILLASLSFANAIEASKTVNVNVKVEEFLRIFNMNQEDDNINLTVNSDNIEKKLEGKKDFCVRSTKQNYKVRVSGDGNDENFVLKNENNDSVAFKLFWGNEEEKELLKNNKETDKSYQVASKIDNCAGGVSTLFVSFEDGAFMEKRNGNYKGSINITVIAE